MSSAEAWQQEKEFLDYMFVSLHGAAASANDEPVGLDTASARKVHTATAAAAAAVACQKSPVMKEAPAGLDHLDNLCKLMEQLGELRDANSRLQKRVQYLEDMKTLQEMHQELDLFVHHGDGVAPSAVVVVPAIVNNKNPEADRSLDSLDGSSDMLPGSSESAAAKRSANKKPTKGHHHMKFKKPALLKYRERSKSVGFDDPMPGLHDGADGDDAAPNIVTATLGAGLSEAYKLPGDVNLHVPTRTPSHRAKTKVSKWTRVKEAFRWEKAHVDPSAPAAAPGGGKAKHLHHHQDKDGHHAGAVHRSSADGLLSPDSPGHAMSKSASPVFRLGRRRRSTSRTSSTSSSSLSECPLESEILKSYADAQELPFFRLEKRASSPEVKLLPPSGSDRTDADQQQQAERVGLERQQRGSVLSLQQTKRLHRQSTISCDGNFATVSSPPVTEKRSPGRNATCSQPGAETAAAESPGRRKTGKASTGNLSAAAELEFEALVETDEPAGFASSCAASKDQQLRPANEWPVKWSAEGSKNGSLASPASQADTSSRNSLSVPSTPMHHQAFTFDVFNESGTEGGSVVTEISRENSPGVRKRLDAEPPPPPTSPMSPGASATNSGSTLIASLAHPGMLLNSISPEFRKKVEAWERLKSGQSEQSVAPPPPPATPPTPTTPQQKKAAENPDWNDITKRRSEPDKLPPAFKKKLAEWEIRKAVAGKSDQNVEELQKILPQDFNRKLQEWERMKQQAAASAAKAPGSPALERQCSGKQSQPSSSSSRGKNVKVPAKSDEPQRGDKQKEKDLQWLEKELQKIEREKLRLEREREKYIERESRLEKIREAMKQPGHGPQREICIRTSTGEFRFQGLSRKFTKKLFQWEEQKGIRPEASTIALLDGAFSPNRPSHHHHLHHHHSSTNEFTSGMSPRPGNMTGIGRSKSESSVVDLVCASVHSQPSSISLNDAETGVDFDRQFAGDNGDEAHGTTGPGALLVEVEDVTEESAAVVEIPEVQPQAPVYSIARPAEFHQSFDNGEAMPHYHVGGAAVPSAIQRNDSVRTEASFKLLEENLSLLDRLRAKGEIVKYLELQMNSIDGDMAGVASTQTEQMDRLKAEEETCLSDPDDGSSTASVATIERLKQRIIQLENKGKQLKAEKENIQTLYRRQCSQQVQLVQHLVEKMQQLRGIGGDIETPVPPLDPDALQRLNTLTSELLDEAKALESTIRNPQSAEQETSPQSAAVVLPERFSLKANQLKEEFERLRSFDTDDNESDADSDDEMDPQDTSETRVPSLPPVPAEMSSAARKKIFVETRRLVFAPVDAACGSDIRSVQATPTEAEENGFAPWRRQKALKETPQDALPWRKNSITNATEDNLSDSCRPATAIRNTAPNIRRMIDKYHQKVTGSGKERPPTLHFRPRDSPGGERSSPSTPPINDILTSKKPSFQAAKQPEASQPSGLLQPMQLTKSQSTGTIGTSAEQPQPAVQSGMIGVLRSKSGHHITGAQPQTTCIRNPSFFRKSPLDPSIDELLQKYRGRRQAAIPSELPKGPVGNPERMLKIRQAREAFLSNGPNSPVIEVIEVPAENKPSSKDSAPSGQSQALVIPDITLVPCEEDKQENREEAAEKNTNSAGLSGSCPSSPALRRNNSGNLSDRGAAHPLSRHSWLKQPTKFFFLKPKTP